MLNIALFVTYFIFCQIIAEKNKIPTFLKEITNGKLIFVSIGFIIASGVISILLNNSLMIMLVTVWCASIVSVRFRNNFGNIERGEV